MIEYNLERRKRKTISINIRKGEVLVFAPLNTPLSVIEKFIMSKHNWIIKKVDNYFARYNNIIDIIELKKVLIFGKSYKIQFNNSAKKITVCDNDFIVPSKYNSEKSFLQAIKRWYKHSAQDYLAKRIKYISDALKIAFSDLKVIDSKSKWGSCDSKNAIALSWRLIMLEQFIVDYVIIHELCHTYYHDHSAVFWKKVEKYCPNYKNIRKILKEKSILIELYR